MRSSQTSENITSCGFPIEILSNRPAEKYTYHMKFEVLMAVNIKSTVSSGMWRHMIRWIGINVSEEPAASFFRGKE
jgi:hypothetical protein